MHAAAIQLNLQFMLPILCTCQPQNNSPHWYYPVNCTNPAINYCYEKNCSSAVNIWWQFVVTVTVSYSTNVDFIHNIICLV